MGFLKLDRKNSRPTRPWKFITKTILGALILVVCLFVFPDPIIAFIFGVPLFAWGLIDWLTYYN